MSQSRSLVDGIEHYQHARQGMPYNGFRGWIFQFLARLFALTPEQGARTIVYLASAPDVADISEQYFVKERAVASSPVSLGEDAARRLWQISADLTDRIPATP